MSFCDLVHCVKRNLFLDTQVANSRTVYLGSITLCGTIRLREKVTEF